MSLLELRRRLTWLWLRERELLLWLGLGTWLGLAERLALTTDLTVRGVADDLGLCALYALLVPPLRRVPRFVRVGVLGMLSLLLVVVVLGDVIHYRYFGFYVNAEDFLLAGQVPAISRSVADLLDPSVVLCAIVAPLLLGGWAVSRSWTYGAQRPRPGGPVTVGVGAVVLAFGAVGSAGHTAAADNNPVMLLARQGAGLLVGPVGGDRVIDELAQGLPAYLDWDHGYRAHVDPEYPLVREPDREIGPERPLNVVVILMESVRAYETGLGLRGVPSVTPNMARLSREALWFPNHYAVGHQTVRGEGAVLCSVLPNYGGAPTYVRYPAVRLRCLPEILRDHGYATHWISGFKSTYFNKREFLTAHGVERIDDMRSVPRSRMKRPKLGWGPSDEDIFDHALSVLDRSKRPFFAEIMTLSNHHPFDHGYGLKLPTEADRVRENKLYRAYQRGVHYTDHAIGGFLRAAAEKRWYRDTVFVIVGDHGARAFPNGLDPERDEAVTAEMFFRSPLLILTPERKGRRVDVVGSQIDIAPTLLDVLGLRAKNAFMGVSLLSEPAAGQHRFAIMAEADTWHVRQGDRYCYGLSHSCVEGGVPPCEAGESPRAQERTCFHVQGDLLDPDAAARTRPLPAADGAPLKALGDRVVRATQALLALDRVYPRAARD